MTTYIIEDKKYSIVRKFQTNTTKTFIEYVQDYFNNKKILEREENTNDVSNIPNDTSLQCRNIL